MHVELIIKFGEYQHMMELMDVGSLYMNTLEFYRKLESDDERKDENEGAVGIMNLKGGTLRIKNQETGIFEEVAMLSHSTIREHNGNIRYLNVYCLHYVKADLPIRSLGNHLNERVKNGFGQYAVVILDPALFVTRVKNAAESMGYRHSRKLVEYKDLTVEKIEVGPFVKDVLYAHQNELRIAVHSGRSENSPIRLEIGCIKDIAKIVPTNSLGKISIEEDVG